MAIKFTTTKDAANLHGVKMLVYGKAGMGKTTLCKTAPKPIIISAESGLLALSDVDIPVIEVNCVDTLSEAYQWATESEEANKFETICLDSLSEIAEVVLSNSKKLTKDPRQAYGELIEKMSDLVRAFRDIKGKHVYMSAKQEYIRDEIVGRLSYGPSMPGTKLGQQLPYFFDELFQLDIAKTDDGADYRYLRTQPDIQFDAKDRSGVLDAIEEPDITKIIKKITTKLKPKKTTKNG